MEGVEEKGREKEECPQAAAAEDDTAAAEEDRPWKMVVLEELFPRLNANGGRRRLTRRRSVAILSALYCSHVFSAWGDRMWQFLVTLLLALLYPGSLLLPALFGLVLALLPALLGTVLGDFVDRNQRMRVVWVSLLVQNTLVCACSVGLAVLFGLDYNICGHVPLYLFILLTALVILLGAFANLATVVNTIAVEKDWIVVIADGNKDILASLNANMRRIDLICKLLAPAVAGVILQFTGALITTIVVASWNVASFSAELGLIWLVYHWVPALAVKKLRKAVESSDRPLIEEEEKEGERGEEEEEGEEGDIGEGEQVKIISEEKDDETAPVKTVNGRAASRQTCFWRFLAPCVSLREGWGIYWRQEIALAGVSIAVIYLTVLGFSGVTASYFLTQGLPNSVIGAGQGIGAIFGVTGTIAYPYIRRRVGTVRTGLIGVTCQLSMLSLCLVAAVIPGERVENSAEGYFSAHCPADNVVCEGLPIPSLLPSPTSSHFSTLPTSHFSYLPTSHFSYLPTSHFSTLPTSHFSHLPTPTPSLVISSDEGSGNGFLDRPIRRAVAASVSVAMATSPTPSPTCTIRMTSSESKVQLNRHSLPPLILMLAGIILARFGLWIFDLAIQQRVQETVAEETRGAVGGVMNAMNSAMDMMHYVLVIVAPRPEHFPILVFISVGMVALGALLYAVYLRRIRGHLFHFQQCVGKCQTTLGHGGGRVPRYQVVARENSVVNEEVL